MSKNVIPSASSQCERPPVGRSPARRDIDGDGTGAGTTTLQIAAGPVASRLVSGLDGSVGCGQRYLAGIGALHWALRPKQRLTSTTMMA